METLIDFLDRKLNPIFEYEITPDKLLLRFGTIQAHQTVTAIKIADNDELTYFHGLLEGRGIDLIGNVVEEGAHVSAITIQKYIGMHLSFDSNNIFIDGR